MRSLAKLVLLFIGLVVVAPSHASDHGKFILTALNIPDVQRGAGLALVLQTPEGKTWLYDTGNGYPVETGPAAILSRRF